MPDWLIPIITAALGALAAVAVATINKRRARASPDDRMDTFVSQIQGDRAEGRAQLATMTGIATQFMGEAVTERSHSTTVEAWGREVEAWIDDGMPDPPGMPVRPVR